MPPSIYNVDDEDSIYGVTERLLVPARVSSGPAPRPPPNLPKFPNNTELVLDESTTNTNLLSALLPALTKYRCLDFQPEKPRRSPWVRAFCDLYHPAGPWGSNRFRNAPSITSQRKYGFKSYQIPTLYRQLQKYQGDSRVHLELKQALQEYFGKEQWYKEFLEGCKQVAIREVNKPMAERAKIPTAESNITISESTVNEPTVTTPPRSPRRRRSEQVVETPRAVESPRARTRSQRRQQEEAEEQEASASAVKSPRRKKRRILDEDEEEQDEKELAAKSARRKKRRVLDEQEEEQEEEKESITSSAPADKKARVAVTPESSQEEGEEEDDMEAAKEKLEEKRAALEKVLSRRRGDGSPGRMTKDSICEKIQTKIDQIDEELLELIMG